MARTPRPWYWEERQAWYVTVNARRHCLGNHPEGCPPPRKLKGRWNAPPAVLQQFHALLARPEAPGPASAPAATGLTVAELFEKFLEWCQRHRSAGTYQWCQIRIQYFVDALGEAAGMSALALRPFHVVEWLDKHPEWSGNYRRGLILAVQRPFNWAVKLGYLADNPLRHFEKPPAERREQVITPPEWAKIRDHYPEGDPFRDLLEFAWETGCRPQEVKNIEARFVQPDAHRVVFPKEESKGKKRARVIYLTPRAEAIVRRLLAARPDGLLFLNADGRKWTGFAMNCRFCRLKKHLGAKYACYALRHGFATRKLEDGLDHLTVAALMGHADGTMVARFYSHIGDREDHLREKLNGGRSADA